jgi:hypothetical protein
MTSTDDRNHSDCDRGKCEIRDIHKKRELVDRNLTKLLGHGHFGCCRKWTTSGEGKGGRLSPWSVGQGSEFVMPIEANHGFRPEYPKDQNE